MVHFIYKTTHVNGKYYIGRHSTEDINDGYIGSGKWPASIKDKNSLVREILEYANNDKELIELEGKYLAEHYGKPNCMNATCDPIGFNSDHNPMKDPTVAAKISGDNHWTRKPGSSEKLRKQAYRNIENGKNPFVGDTNPMKKPENRKAASIRRTEQNLTKNPSTINAAKGTHHWQNGNSPNFDGKLNKKLIAEGRHNFQGPEHNRKMIAEGKNPWVGPDSNNRRLAEGTHPSQQKKVCEHCLKEISIGMYVRWHGDKCNAKI